MSVRSNATKGGASRLRRLRRVMMLGTLSVLFGGVGACRDEEPLASAAQPEPSASAEQGPRTLRVDPELVKTERIKTEAVVKRGLADEVMVSAAVLTSVEGEARLGALVSGRIARVLVREGERVKKGQVLAWIDAPDAARMQGEFVRARVRVWRAEKQWERESALWKDQATSARALEDAEGELRAARAEESAARSMLATSRIPAPSDGAKSGAARIGVTSPIDGVVAARTAVVGDHVSPDDSLFEIIDPARVLVRADVPEVMARRVEAGAAALVRPIGSNEGCRGVVKSKLERIDEAKRTMGVMIELQEGCPGMSAGGFADATLRLTPSGSQQVLVVPREALVDLDGVPMLFVERAPHGTGLFEVRIVRTGLSDGAHVVVEEGLREGERVATVGAFLLKGEHMKAELGGE